MTASSAPKKASHEDWHPAEVVAAIRMKGFSLRQLALLNGYGNANSLTSALRRPYPLAEALIAEAIGVEPKTIWPSRYDRSGEPNRGRPGQKALLPANAKRSSLRPVRNAQKAAR